MPFDGTTFRCPKKHRADVGAVLLGASALLEDPRKWMKHDFQDGDRRCTITAIAVAGNWRLGRVPAYVLRPVAASITRNYPHIAERYDATDEFGLIHAFNDDERTSHAAVMLVLGDAIPRRQRVPVLK